jgi:branched-chain amino acid transport system permease protein
VIAYSAHETVQTLVDATALGAIYALIAVGIGLVFGVLRLVNFAYGQLIMAGAYALALTNGINPFASIVVCFAVVLGLTLTMELVAFRPLRNASPATMLVATFAISFLLQSIALLSFGSKGNSVSTLPRLNTAAHIGSLHVRWVTIVSIVVTVVLLAGTGLLLNRTSIGLQMRAAALDFRAARLLGVRTDRVISLTFVVAGVMAACVSVLLTVQTPFVQPSFGAQILIPALVGVVVGGLDRLVTATLGAFAIGFVTSFLGDVLASSHRVYIDSYVFLLVILVLLVRPAGLFAPFRATTVERV